MRGAMGSHMAPREKFQSGNKAAASTAETQRMQNRLGDGFWIFLDPLFDVRACGAQVLNVHAGAKLDLRVQSEEEVLGDVRDLGCVFEIEDEVGAAVTVVSGEVGGFGLEFVHEFLDYILKGTVADGGVSAFGGDLGRKHHSHLGLLL
jgi:hypothetical protein